MMHNLFGFPGWGNPFWHTARLADGWTGLTGAMLGGGLALMGIIALVAVGLFALWLWMLVVAIRIPLENKAIWIALLLVGGWIAALVFYFAAYRPTKRGAGTGGV